VLALRASRERMRAAMEEMRARRTALHGARRGRSVDIVDDQQLFDRAPLAYLVTDVAGTIRRANSAAAELLRTTAKGLVGQPLAGFVARADRDGFRAAFDRVRGREGETEEWPVRLRARDGALIDARVAASPQRADDGSLGAVYWIVYHEGHSLDLF
jgi:PAS domain S-box-containing protein